MERKGEQLRCGKLNGIVGWWLLLYDIGKWEDSGFEFIELLFTYLYHMLEKYKSTCIP